MKRNPIYKRVPIGQWKAITESHTQLQISSERMRNLAWELLKEMKVDRTILSVHANMSEVAKGRVELLDIYINRYTKAF